MDEPIVYHCLSLAILVSIVGQPIYWWWYDTHKHTHCFQNRYYWCYSPISARNCCCCFWLNSCSWSIPWPPNLSKTGQLIYLNKKYSEFGQIERTLMNDNKNDLRCNQPKIDMISTRTVVGILSVHCTQSPRKLLAAGLFLATRRYLILNAKGLRCLMSGSRCPDSA